MRKTATLMLSPVLLINLLLQSTYYVSMDVKARLALDRSVGRVPTFRVLENLPSGSHSPCSKCTYSVHFLYHC